MYSYEKRIKAVKLYIQYDKSYASVFRELGYPPSSHTIKLWYKEYKQHGDLHKSFIKASKYSDEQRQAAIQYYIEHGRSKARTVRALGYPCRQQLTEWIKQDLPEEVRPCTKGQSLVYLTKEQKGQVRIFDNANVFTLKGNSYRGKELENFAVRTNNVKALEEPLMPLG